MCGPELYIAHKILGILSLGIFFWLGIVFCIIGSCNVFAAIVYRFCSIYYDALRFLAFDPLGFFVVQTLLPLLVLVVLIVFHSWSWCMAIDRIISNGVTRMDLLSNGTPSPQSRFRTITILLAVSSLSIFRYIGSLFPHFLAFHEWKVHAVKHIVYIVAAQVLVSR
jgi:hypothetical protein